MKIIDLGKDLYVGMEVYPGDPAFKKEKIHDLETQGWNLSKISLGLHTGSHVDAPYHMDDLGKTLDQVPLENFFGQAIKTENLDLLKNDLGLIIASPLKSDQIQKILAIRPKFVGGNIDQEAERAFLKSGIITYTDLENLDLLPLDKIFIFIGLPLKILGADGSPVRPVALIEEG